MKLWEIEALKHETKKRLRRARAEGNPALKAQAMADWHKAIGALPHYRLAEWLAADGCTDRKMAESLARKVERSLARDPKKLSDMLGHAPPPIDHETLVDRIECLLKVSNELGRIGTERDASADNDEISAWIVDQWLRPSVE